MRRTGLLLAALCLLLGATAAAAEAHPLGNFSINHLTKVSVSRDRVDLRYILDQAEIPTFQERGVPPSEVLARKREEVARGLTATLDGRPLPLRLTGNGAISHPPGQGGLPLTRVELRLTAPVAGAHRIVLHDGTFPDRVGWKAIVAQPGRGTAARSSAPSGDPTNELRSYPTDMLQSPLNERVASFATAPGRSTLVAPREAGAGATTTNLGGDGFAAVFASAAAGKGVLVLFLLAAFAWGAIHALSPGHGKTMVAAYLVGTRGTPRHAMALGAITTITHTIGVFALGGVTLVLARYVLPEQLYPWLSLVSGLMVVAIGAVALRSRLRWRRAQSRPVAAVPSPPEHAHNDAHEHALASSTHEDVGFHHTHGTADDEEGHSHSDGSSAHGQSHGHGDHGHDHSHEHADHSHGHSHGAGHHHHHPPEHVTWRALVGMGASAGLIPCPSALVVLLGAIAQHQVALGLILILSFSLGLAATLTGLGLAVVWARRATARLSFTGPLVTALPALSTALIIGLGLLLTARAIPKLV